MSYCSLQSWNIHHCSFQWQCSGFGTWLSLRRQRRTFEPKVSIPCELKLYLLSYFFFLDFFATLHLNQKHRHLVTLLASPPEMFLVNHGCHSTREFFNHCTWCLVQVWVFLSMFLGWACPEISSPFCLQQFRAPLCVVVGCVSVCLKCISKVLVLTPVSQYWCCSVLKF